MSSPYWDGLYSREAEPPPGLTGVDRESWLRGKQEALVAKAAFQQPVPTPPVAASTARPLVAAEAPRPAAQAARSWALGVNWRRTGLLIGAVVLLLGVGAAVFYGAASASTAGWLLFAVAVVGLVWRLAGPDVASR